ncbi:MAG: hypothetical protein KAR40_15325 [Candidatus Sabulitectum sp.]|nr:hypothetical protein [Candidatus Sabulitectum sp.]
MAVTVQNSAQLDLERQDVRSDHGKFRLQYFKATQDGVGDATSSWNLCKLPPGNVRVLPGLSRYSISALGAARTLDFGHLAYENSVDGALIAADPDAFVADIDASSAITGAALDTAIKIDLYSRRGITVTAQVNDATIPDAAVLEGYIAYAYE